MPDPLDPATGRAPTLGNHLSRQLPVHVRIVIWGSLKEALPCSRLRMPSRESKMSCVGGRSRWNERKAKLVGLYRQLAHRHARVERAKAEVGADAFLSGHDGWFFHRGIRETPDERHS